MARPRLDHLPLNHLTRPRPTLLALSSGDLGAGRVLEESPDAACDVALEATSDLAGGLALRSSSGSVVAGGRVRPAAGERDDVERAVELSIAASVEAALARSRGERRDASDASERCFVATTSSWRQSI